MSRQVLAASPHTPLGDVGLEPEWIRDAAGEWCVVHTRARHEKAVADALSKQGVPHYLPLISRERKYAKSREVVHLPLFPGYLFICGGHAACEAAWRTNRVANILKVADQQNLRDELVGVAQVLQSGEMFDAADELWKGRRCRITEGVLKDLEGVVQGRGRRRRMHVAVTILGQGVVVEVEASQLEPLD